MRSHVIGILAPLVASLVGCTQGRADTGIRAAPGPDATRDSIAAKRIGMAETEVIVSRTEARIVFPPDPARTWGWPDRDPVEYGDTYRWGVSVEGVDRPLIVSLEMFRSDSARRFPSLEALVQQGEPMISEPGMFQHRVAGKVTAGVRRGRLVLAVRDSAAVRRLFGMRPSSVRVWHSRPDGLASGRWDSVTVRYVDPQMPVPDSAFRAAASLARRRYEASITSRRRYIADGRSDWGTLWLQPGDSAQLYLSRSTCRHDLCRAERVYTPDSGWTTGNRAIALVRVHGDSSDRIARVIDHRSGVYLIGVRPGSTTVRIDGLPDSVDREIEDRVPERSIEREVVVLPEIGRIGIVLARDTVAAGELVEVHVVGFDADGRRLGPVPADLTFHEGQDRSTIDGSRPVYHRYRTPGTKLLTARLGAQTDTARVVIVGRG